MKGVFFGVAALVATLCLFVSQTKAQPRPIFSRPTPGLEAFPACNVPDIFYVTNTKYNYSGSASQCKTKCIRRSVSTWTQPEWDLYAQLWLQANRWGWIEGLREGHALDNCTGNQVTGIHFHFNETFLPWHRFFISHYEQLFQKIDHIINPGRAAKSGEFCLGFWDWGYQEPYSPDLTSSTYKYIWNASRLGTLNPGSHPVPDSRYANVAINGSTLIRDPQTGVAATAQAPFINGSWNSIQVSTCLSLTDMVGDNQPFFVPFGTDLTTFNPSNRSGLGFRGCTELLYHGSIHTAIGGFTGQMGNLSLSSSEPAFFLHHTMIDYTWWIWEHLQGKTYPASWIAEKVAVPYDQWTLGQARDWSSFCYDYQPNSYTTCGKAQYPAHTQAPGNYSDLPKAYQSAVDRVIQQGPPAVIPYNTYKKVLSMSNNEEQARNNYQEYLAYLRLSQIDHANIVGTYINGYNIANKQNAAPPTSPGKGGNTVHALNSVLGQS